MSINPLHEQPISLPEAADMFSANAAGKKPHVSQLYRYTTVGLRGVLLESIQCGSRRCTSREAVARFFLRLTAQCDHTSGGAPCDDSSRLSTADVERILDDANQ